MTVPLDVLPEHCTLTMLAEISARRSLSALACLDFRFLASQTGREGEGCKPLDDVCLQSNVSQRTNVLQNFVNEVFHRLLDFCSLHCISYFTDLDPCRPNPCLNSGACLHTDGGFVCNCSIGFKGKHCQGRSLLSLIPGKLTLLTI